MRSIASAPESGAYIAAVLALRASELVKRFDSRTALDSVSIELQAGEVRGLLGPNGAGKTTLLRTLFGLLGADAGEIELLGHRLRAVDGPEHASPLAGVGGFVEEPAFYPYLTARANLELLAKLDGGGARARIGDALTRVGLADRADERVGGFSTGMRQRLGIAAALLRSPRLLLLDEPTSGLDPPGIRSVASLLRELSADGAAILVSSHQIGELERICDSYTFLHHGKVVWDGSAERLIAEAPAPAHTLHTSDDTRAIELARSRPDVSATAAERGEALIVEAHEDALDSFGIALGRADIAIRRLEPITSPLETMFTALTTPPL
jgi:ABC-2 type transport system ATP-binding protein